MQRATQAGVKTALVLAVSAMLTGCAGFFTPQGTGTNTGTASTDIVYVANANADSLAAYSIANGTLTAVTGSPFALGFAPTAVVVAESNAYLYVSSANAVYLYDISSTGALTIGNSSAAVAANITPAAMDVSPDGNWLAILNSDGVHLYLYQITTSGTSLGHLTALSTTILTATTPVAQAVKFAPNGEALFVALGTGGDVGFSFTTSTGALGAAQALAEPTGDSDNALAIDSNSARIYIARSGSTAPGLYVFSIGTNASLTAVTGTPNVATGDSAPHSVVLDKTSTYVYAGDRSSSTVTGYSISASNGTVTLTSISGSPFATGEAPVGLAADNSDAYILAISDGLSGGVPSTAVAGSPDLEMYGFDANSAGRLYAVSSTTTGSDPTGPIAIATTH